MARSNPTLRPLLSVSEAAALLGVSRNTLYRALHSGSLPFPVVVLNGTARIPRRAVERVVAGEDPSREPHPDEAVSVSPSSRSRPMCSAARRSSSSMPSV